jgi:hypothetical protein
LQKVVLPNHDINENTKQGKMVYTTKIVGAISGIALLGAFCYKKFYASQ